MSCLFLPRQNNVSALQDLLAELISGDEARAEKAASALIQLGDEMIPVLLELTRSSDVNSRWWALRVLAGAPQAQAEWLLPFLNDPAPEVRQCAALGLAAKPDESAIQPLVQVLSDEDGLVGSLTSNALVRIGRAAVPALIEVVKQGNQSARIHALRALAEIRDHRAIPVMMKAMEEDLALLQHWAQEGLKRLGLDMVYIKPV